MKKINMYSVKGGRADESRPLYPDVLPDRMPLPDMSKMPEIYLPAPKQ